MRVFFFSHFAQKFGTPFLGFRFALKNFFRGSVVVNMRDDDDDEVQHTHTQQREGFVTQH